MPFCPLQTAAPLDRITEHSRGVRRTGRRAAVRLATAIALCGASWGQGPPAVATSDAPWRLAEALGTPEWFLIKGKFNARFESLSDRLRAGETGSNQGLFTRTLLEMTVRDTFLDFTVEMADSRISDEPADARPTTGQVNTAEVLQGYVAGRFTDAFEPGDRLRVQFGRHTMDVGSRRLVARNIYRNTINAFTGAGAQWTSAGGTSVRAFYTLPIQRLPGNGEIDRLRDNDIRTDEERSSVRFWGAVATVPDVLHGTSAAAYFFGLDESDAPDLATADRDLNTAGTRWNRTPARARAHWEWESAYQFGTSRASSASTTDLDHSAWLHHLSLGYTLDHATLPRLEALFDYASGDRNPTDGDNGRFDSLYGIPRQDFGPTGIFREVARANVLSPGVRLVMVPADHWNVMLMQRFNYLASDRDAWTTTGIQDPSGGSGRHIGDLSELRVRYDWAPGSIRFEVGLAYHSAGGFAENAPNSNGGKNATFGYFQTTFTF